MRKGLSEQGYFEGRNFVFESRTTEDYNQLQALASELIARRVAVIFTFPPVNTAKAAMAATARTPIVFATGADPVLQGLVVSFNRPGANVTGISLVASEMLPKRLELLRELVPQASTIAYLTNPTAANTEFNNRTVLAAAHSVRQRLNVVNASTPAEIDTAFATLAREGAGGLLVEPDGFFNARRSQIIVLAARYVIPTVYWTVEFPRAGGLMSYSSDVGDSYRQAGLYIGRILKGEKAGDLPVQQPTKFTFAINLSTAKALNIEFPPSFHLRADIVIE